MTGKIRFLVPPKAHRLPFDLDQSSSFGLAHLQSVIVMMKEVMGAILRLELLKQRLRYKVY